MNIGVPLVLLFGFAGAQVFATSPAIEETWAISSRIFERCSKVYRQERATNKDLNEKSKKTLLANANILEKANKGLSLLSDSGNSFGFSELVQDLEPDLKALAEQLLNRYDSINYLAKNLEDCDALLGLKT